MPAENTPMKSQYNAIKAQHPDCLLFFRLGDFYEMFDEDAVVGSKELELALTTRDRGRPEEERTPMCGVPYHSAEQYISRLIQKGYKVAVCEQLEDPRLAKGIVKRDVIRIISPGTVIESSMLTEGESNYLAALFLDGESGSCAFADVSTGEVCAASFPDNAAVHLINELGRFRPREAVLSEGAAKCVPLTDALEKRYSCRRETADARFDPAAGEEALSAQYGSDAASLGLDGTAGRAVGALLGYLSDAQRGDMSQLRRPDVFTRGRFMELDSAARRHLELTENLRTGEKRGSLLWVLDKTRTPMGGRTLRSWVERPLLSAVAIRRRLSAVDELYKDNVGRGELIELLRSVGDIQRLTSRAVYGTANGRDMLSLGRYLGLLPEIFSRLRKYRSAMLTGVSRAEPLEDVAGLLRRAIADEPPFSVREGGILRQGYSEEVDRLRDIRSNGARRVAERVDAIQNTAAAVGELDALCSLAEVAVRNNYVCPQIEISRQLHITQGRHPVVEQMQPDVLFVPNDTDLNDGDDRVAIVTGPNMAGKSTYMRQTAIIVLMAQMGSFVPAKDAVVGVVDRVFTRIGASDDLAGGQSTFMVEMSEVASILKNATADSLLILDEIGRGTSTYDGMAIARAVLEYCADRKRLGAKTMFATHYHELSALEGSLPGVRNYNISAKKQGGKLVFLRRILPGATDESYGIEVAKLAGVPDAVIRAASVHLKELTAQGAAPSAPAAPEDDGQVTLTDMGGTALIERLRGVDPDSLTPREALTLLYELKKEADAH